MLKKNENPYFSTIFIKLSFILFTIKSDIRIISANTKLFHPTEKLSLMPNAPSLLNEKFVVPFHRQLHGSKGKNTK